MKKLLLAALVMFSGGVSAVNHEVKMLDNGKDGSMVFEPAYIKAEKGDTVTFVPSTKGHWVQSRAIPEGAAKFLSKEDEEFVLTLDHEGLYFYICPPHRAMNMAGFIQVGEAVNKEVVEKEVEKIEKRATENKGRLFEYLDQVK